MRVKDIMTPRVISVAEHATLWDALQAITENHVSALVVTDEHDAPVGVLSEGDLLRRAELGTQKRRPSWLEFLVGGGRAAEEYRLSHARRVGEIMTRGALTIAPDADVAQAVDAMLAHKIKRLVVARDGRAVGVVSRSDVLKALMAALPRPGGRHSDVEILDAIEAELDHEIWAPKGAVRATVKDGVVTLEGAIADERLRGALRVLAENVDGVKSVRDKMAWIEPNSGYLAPGPENGEDE